MVDIDRIAEAIRYVDVRPHASELSHPIAHYRRMAQAAIDSLELTEEWQVSRKTWHRGVSGKKVNHVDHIGPTTEEHAAEMAANLDGAYIESRLVSPWVRSEDQ